jgi:murein DD-endopeptidase MepM/ murein hydrolase activator NlpD
MTTTSHSFSSGASRSLLLSAALIVLALGGGIAARPGSSAGAARASAAHAYGWPVKPFDQPHPVRGSFGDPRTIFSGPPTPRTLLSGAGQFTFHTGVDISAPDGTAVYPVESGTVRATTAEWVSVDCGGGVSFKYWHVTPSVSAGQHVEADVTVLGHIIRGTNHVHLTEYSNGVEVNPLAPGHLGPYTDSTKPTVDSIEFRTSIAGDELMPEFVRGRVVIVTSAYDMPSSRVPGVWHDLPVTPALVEWRIQRADTGKVVVPTRVAYDVRQHLPAPGAFWNVYARGTHQNMSVFGKHYSYMQPGVYRFLLTPQGVDTRTMSDGVYELVVTATDIRSNHSSLVQRFSIENRGL